MPGGPGRSLALALMRSARPVERTADAPSAGLVDDVGVDHGGFEIAVAEKFLDRGDVAAVGQEVGGEAVPQGVAVDG